MHGRRGRASVLVSVLRNLSLLALLLPQLFFFSDPLLFVFRRLLGLLFVSLFLSLYLSELFHLTVKRGGGSVEHISEVVDGIPEAIPIVRHKTVGLLLNVLQLLELT